MASSASTTLRLELMATGENDTTWGNKINTNFQIMESAVSGATSVSTTGGNTTLTNVDYTNDQAKKAVLDVTGALVSNATITIPNAAKVYRVLNRTSGAYTLGINRQDDCGRDMTHDPYRVEPRKPLTAKQKLKMFIAHGGICCLCNLKINGVHEAWDEHINPLWLNGDNGASNRAPAHVKCAQLKTAGEAKSRAKTRSKAEKHFGAKARKSRPMMGTKASGWRKPMNGKAERRET